MSLINNNNIDDPSNIMTTPLTLEESYLAFDRLNPFHAAGAPSVAMIRRLAGQAHARKLFYGRQTLLHKCCCEGYADRLDLIQALVEVSPQAVEMYDQDGYWPLHYVVSATRQQRGRHVNTKVVEYLIQQGPLALLQTTRNERRAIPLHLAVENPFLTLPLLDLLLQVFPETIHYRDAQGNVPIDCAMQTSGLSLEVIQRLVNAAPVLLSFVKDDGWMLPHHFVHQLEPVDDKDDNEMTWKSTPAMIHATSLLEILIQACPGALRVQTPDRMTPLVLACQGQASVPCIYTLLRAWPEQVTTQRHLIFDDLEWNGVWLPTHLMQTNLSWRRVLRWLDEDERATQRPDAAGRVALHYAVVTRAACATALVKRLLQLYPAAVRHMDAAGRLPLHYLALSTHEQREELLEMVLSADHGDDGLAIQDTEGCLPWMYAELVHFTAVYEASLAQGMSLDHTEDLPSEVRWDIVQVVPDEEKSTI